MEDSVPRKAKRPAGSRRWVVVFAILAVLIVVGVGIAAGLPGEKTKLSTATLHFARREARILPSRPAPEETREDYDRIRKTHGALIKSRLVANEALRHKDIAIL